MAVFEDFVEIISQIHCLNHAHAHRTRNVVWACHTVISQKYAHGG